MTDQQTPNQAKVKVSDRLIASGAVVEFERLTWTDFPLETRLRALRLMLDALARRREKRRIETQIEAAPMVELKAA